MKKAKPLLINTKRLSLHSIENTDKQYLIELLTNEIISKTYMVPAFKNNDEKEKMFDHFKKISNNLERFLYGIYLNEKLIGFINDVEIIEDEIELGFVIHPKYHNFGYATEVLKKCIEELFNTSVAYPKLWYFGWITKPSSISSSIISTSLIKPINFSFK